MPTSPNEDDGAHAAAPEATVDIKVLRSPSVHSPCFDHPMESSPGHPLVVDLSEGRFFIPS